MTTLDFRTSEVKADDREPVKASRPPGVFLLFVMIGVAIGLAAVVLIGG